MAASIVFCFAFANEAEAFGSLIGKIVSKYKKQNSEEKKITVFNQQKEDHEEEAEVVHFENDIEEKLEKYSRQEKQEQSLRQGGWNWQEVQEAVDFASKKTGVRREFLLGMLAVESDLGRNTGECSYQEVERGAEDSYSRGRLSHRSWRTFQHRKSLIKGIADGLGYDYKELRVSCNPAQYTGTGGALGVPQFMPDTWLEYKDRIAKAVDKENPDPWDLKDGVTAMALKLSDCPGVANHNRAAEKNAAKLYLSGTTSWQYNWYANLVHYWAENYARLVA